MLRDNLDSRKSSKSKNPDMTEIVIELKNKIHEKELEILELKNAKVKKDMEN